MADILDALLRYTSACATASVLGACFTLGAYVVCKLTRWAPVNVTVRVTNNYAAPETENPHE